MCKATHCLSAWGAVLLTAAGLSACGRGGSGDVVARVGGNAIARATFDHWLSIETATKGRPVPGQTVSNEALKQRVLGFLISAQWTIGEAAELGVRVSDQEVQKQLVLFKYEQLEGLRGKRFPQEADLQRSLAGSGETRSDQLWLMRLNMLAARIEQERLSEAQRQVTDAQIAQYYDKNWRHYVLPERRQVEVIATFKEATAEKAKREVQSGKSFLSVLKRVSIYPEDPEGLPYWPKEKQFHKHVFAARLHVLTGPVHQILYYVFEVTKVTPPRRLTLAQTETSIRQRLGVRRQRRARTHLIEALDKKWTAKTDCRAGYVVPRCRQYMGAMSAARSSLYFE